MACENNHNKRTELEKLQDDLKNMTEERDILWKRKGDEKRLRDVLWQLRVDFKKEVTNLHTIISNQTAEIFDMKRKIYEKEN